MKRGNASGWLLRGSLALLFGAVLTGMLGSAPSKADDHCQPATPGSAIF